MSALTDWYPNYKNVFGKFTNPHPSDDTLMSDLKFVPQESRGGTTYNVPVQVTLEQGITTDVSGDAFAIKPARGSIIKNAQVEGATLLMTGTIPYDAMLRSRNGTGDKKKGNAFKDAFKLKTLGLMEQHEFYSELSMLYGCGTGGTITSDIGVVDTGVQGANLDAQQVCPFTIASWAPGIWARMTNALVDVYAANGTTLIASDVEVISVDPDYAPSGTPKGPNVTLYKNGATGITVAAGHRIVPAGWATKSCFGLETQLKNTGTLFGINAAQYSVWKPVRYSNASGAFGRQKLLALMARMYPNGGRNGGNLYVSPPTFADMAEEADTLQRFVGQEVKQQGDNKLLYKSPAGVVTVKLLPSLKFSQAFFMPKGAAEIVGTSPITFRGEGDEWFFLEMPNNAGSQIRSISNMSPFVRMPNRCAWIDGIVNNGIA